MNRVRVGIAGFGTVGRATAEILAAHADLIAQRSGVRLDVTAVCRSTAFVHHACCRSRCTAPVTQAQVGHMSVQMVEHYTHICQGAIHAGRRTN
jgi:homoserine dehydrogenase